VTSCIGFGKSKANGATPMSDDIIPDGDEWDRPVKYEFTAALRMVEMLRSDLNNDVSFLSLNHFAILLIVFEMEDERFGIEAQTIHSLAAVEKSTANRIIHSLSDKGRVRDGLGYLRVDTDVNDRRIRRIFLTEKGRFLKQQMASAGTAIDNVEVTKLHEAFNATRLTSLENANQPKEDARQAQARAQKERHARMEPNSIKAGKPQLDRVSIRERRRDAYRDAIQSRQALDRAMKAAMLKKSHKVRFQGDDVPIVSADRIREIEASRGDEVSLVNFDGYWMIMNKERYEKGYMRPECIQSNLKRDTDLLDYMNQLFVRLDDGETFSYLMSEAKKYLNQTEYNRLRGRMNRDLVDTRDTLMRDTAKKLAEIEKLENVAGGLHSAAVRNRQQAGQQFQSVEKMAKQSQSYPVHMLNEKMDLIASVTRSNREAKEQVELADKLEADADEMVKEAEQLREEKRAMQKALEDNAKAMAEMQAMMKQMMEKGD
jgi:DNA-binding MarR family transcriptional regulator